MAGVSVLVALWAFITVVHSGPQTYLNVIPDANSYYLHFTFNTTTSLYNGTDVSKAVARSNIWFGMWSDKKPKLSEAAEKFASSKAVAGVSVADAQMGSDGEHGEEGKALPLVYSYNVTEMDVFGPKECSLIYEMNLAVWAKKWQGYNPTSNLMGSSTF